MAGFQDMMESGRPMSLDSIANLVSEMEGGFLPLDDPLARASDLALRATLAAEHEQREAGGDEEKQRRIVEKLAKIAGAIGRLLQKAGRNAGFAQVSVTVSTRPLGVSLTATWDIRQS